MGQDAIAGVGAYSNLPDIIYAKRNSDNTLTFLNKFTRLTSAPPAEYSIKTNWLRNLWVTSATDPVGVPCQLHNLAMARVYRRFGNITGTVCIAPYIIPLYQTVRAACKMTYGY